MHLLERKDGLLRCASGINQFRLHGGYHYPRSPETIAECKSAFDSFKEVYGEAISSGQHLYAIARHGSKLTAQEYIRAICENELEYGIASACGLVDLDEVELMLEVNEAWLDVTKLRGLVWHELMETGVHVHLNTPADGTLRDEFDKIIIAGYAGTNAIARLNGAEETEFQYEICEKVVLKMPKEWQRTGLVIMDGEFCSLDPYLGTPYHLLGHVKHAIHHRVDGLEPYIPEYVRDYIDAGVVSPMPMRTKIALMLDAASVFIPALEDAEYVGSMYTVRVVMPNVEDTDERPTIVQELDAQVIRILSGKIGCAVDAANRTVELVGTQSARDAA